MKFIRIFFLRLYQLLIMLPLMLVFTSVTAITISVTCMIFGGRWWGYYPAIIWARLMAWVSLVRVTVRGHENVRKNTSYVFVANHTGAYDIFAIYGWLGHNFKWMMKQGLRKIPLVGFACARAGHIYVDKSSPSAIKKTMEKAEKQLAKGMSVVVFPEGTRTRTGKMGVFKRGAYLLATEFSLPVVPITIIGAYEVMPIGSMLPNPGHIEIVIHKPIEPGKDGHDIKRLIDESREAIASSL